LPLIERDTGSPVETLVVTLKLRKRTDEQAAKLIAAGPPFDPADLGLARHAVYLGGDPLIFRVLKERMSRGGFAC
jgi:hypothetical protein